MISQWEHHILSIKGCDAIRPKLNCFISMIISVGKLSGFPPLEVTHGVFRATNRELSFDKMSQPQLLNYLLLVIKQTTNHSVTIDTHDTLSMRIFLTIFIYCYSKKGKVFTMND